MPRHAALFLFLAVLCTALLHAADAGTVEGKLVIDGKTIKLTHVYAIVVPVEGHEVLYRIIFSDVALTDNDLAHFPDDEIRTDKRREDARAEAQPR